MLLHREGLCFIKVIDLDMKEHSHLISNNIKGERSFKENVKKIIRGTAKELESSPFIYF